MTAQMKIMRIATLLAVLAGLAIAHHHGVFNAFSDPVRLKQTLLDLGPWGYLAFIGSYAALQPFGVPGTIFVMAAPLIWSWPVAFALSMTGTMAASVVGFGFARFVARDWVATRIPARFRKYDDALARRAFTTVFLLRLIFWMPPLLHAFFGISRVSFATHFWGSLAGYALPLLLMSFFGQELFAWLRALPVSVWMGAGVAVVLVAGALGVLRWRRRREVSRL
jgi:uncharacterized membrane protein YdjX (TVP38/TMEM64 family)